YNYILPPDLYPLSLHDALPISTIKWVIEEGSLVKRGDRILQLDDSSLREQRVEQKVRVEQAEAVHAQAAETLALVKKETRAEIRSEEHTSELQSRGHIVCRLLL